MNLLKCSIQKLEGLNERPRVSWLLFCCHAKYGPKLERGEANSRLFTFFQMRSWAQSDSSVWFY